VSGKQIIGIVCFVLAAVLVVVGLLSLATGPGLMDRSGLGVSHAVGSFLPALLILILGLWLFQKPRGKKE
jgi:hypothetical protein